MQQVKTEPQAVDASGDVDMDAGLGGPRGGKENPAPNNSNGGGVPRKGVDNKVVAVKDNTL